MGKRMSAGSRPTSTNSTSIVNRITRDLSVDDFQDDISNVSCDMEKGENDMGS